MPEANLSRPDLSNEASKIRDDGLFDNKHSSAPNDQSTFATTMDFTKVPSSLDANFDKLDSDNALKPTIINVGDNWKLKQSKTLLSKAHERNLDSDDQKTEKTRCFDLLDAMSCSGSLPIECATLHVVVAATHCFDETIVNTIIRKNVNPIEKVERSTLIVAGTIHDKPANEMVRTDQAARIQRHSPQLTGDQNPEAIEQQ